MAPEFMKDVFKIKNHQYNFPKDVCLQRRNVNTFLHVTETKIASLRAQILNLLSKNLKYSKSFKDSNKNIRKWTTKECPCRLCKVYVQN